MALLSLLACACSSDDVSSDTVPVNDTQVSFILSLNNATNGTRASWGAGYDPQQVGDSYENNIDPEHLQVALYYKDNQLAANVTILSYLPIESENPGEQLYRFIGTVNSVNGAELTSGDYKIMVFANCVSSDQSDLSVPSDLSDPSALSYDYNAGEEVKAGTQLIPMWGVTTANLKLKKGQRDEVGTIDLLRAFAKVEINLHDDISGTYTITSATLNNYNTKGYCLPAGYASVDKTVDLDQEDGTNSSFNPNDSPSQTALDFDYSEDKKSAYLYIPEYANSNNSAQIQLTLSDGKNETITGTLYFKDYDTNGAPTTGDAHDIVRNHIYRYTVNVEQGNLIVQAKVMPWQLVTSSIGWAPQPASTDKNPFEGDAYDDFVKKGSYILLPIGDFDEDEGRTTVQTLFSYLYSDASKGDDDARYCILTKPTYVDGAHKILKTGTAGARYFFMLTGPEGCTWEAHLTNEEDFTFSYSDVSGFDNSEYSDEGKVYMTSHGRARLKPYIIQINARMSYTGVDENAETGENGNAADVAEYPWYLDKDYWNGDKSMVDKIDDTGKNSWWEKNDRRNNFYAKYDAKGNSQLEAAYGYLTKWGAEKWYGQKVVDTEFYITVKLSDGKEYELNINPQYSSSVVNGTLYKGNRRYAGTDTRIWIRQVRAQYNKDYKYLAEDIDPLNKDFEWWRVNPYWKK